MPYITHTDDLIYGLGANGTDSRINAQRELGAAHIHLLSDDDDSTEQLGLWMRATTLRTTPCTDALAELVEARGGDCAWQIVDGVADVIDQEEV
jgi:hypothetical protein